MKSNVKIFSLKKSDKKDNKIKTCVKNYTSPLPSLLVGLERKYKSKFYLVPIMKSMDGREKNERKLIFFIWFIIESAYIFDLISLQRWKKWTLLPWNIQQENKQTLLQMSYYYYFMYICLILLVILFIYIFLSSKL